MMRPSENEVTRLLAELGEDRDPETFDRLLSVVYDELRTVARRYLDRERPGHTLQPTALVNEAFFKLAGESCGYESRAHFLAVAATAMRRILVDHARSRASLRRGGDRQREVLDSDLTAAESDDVDLTALDAALTKLARVDEQKVRIVEMRFFVGLSIEDTAAALDTSPSSVKREWRTAKIWLKREIDRLEAS